MSAQVIALCAACIDENDRIAHGTPLTPAAQRAMERQRERLQSLYLLLCEETAVVAGPCPTRQNHAGTVVACRLLAGHDGPCIANNGDALTVAPALLAAQSSSAVRRR